MQYDILVVGAGMTGATAARRLAESGARVLLIDAHDHVAGHCYDRYDAHGLLVHQYGPHIFHTVRQDVADFLSRFTTWRPYEHRVVGLIDNRLVPLPINLTAIEMLFPGSGGRRISARLQEIFGLGAQVPILELRISPHAEFVELAAFVYEKVFEGYTRKQWGLPPDGIDPAITGRVPVRVSYDDRYFTDSFQRMPEQGYTAMIAKIVQHENIDLHLGTPFVELPTDLHWKRCIYTGPVDEFFAGCHGWLPYRNLEFTFEHYAQELHQPVGVVNYPDFAVPFTRITEFRHLTGQQAQGTKKLGTSVCLEYSRAHVPGVTTPYYPVLTTASSALLQSYQATAWRERPHILFTGRLGGFKYINMDEAVLAGFAAAQQIVSLP